MYFSSKIFELYLFCYWSIQDIVTESDQFRFVSHGFVVVVFIEFCFSAGLRFRATGLAELKFSFVFFLYQHRRIYSIVARTYECAEPLCAPILGWLDHCFG